MVWVMTTNELGAAIRFATATTAAVSDFGEALFFADFNRDGRLDLLANRDLLLQQPNVTRTRWLGRSAGGLLAPTNTGRGGVLSFDLADVNGDGHLDQIMSGFNQGLFISLGIGNGAFTNQPPVQYVINGNASSAFAVGDYNNDLKPDIAIFHNQSSSYYVTVLTNYSDGASVGPRLKILSAPTNATSPSLLSWSRVNSGFFGLEFRSALTPNSSWQTVTGTIVRSGTENFLTNIPGTSRGFYRLRQR